MASPSLTVGSRPDCDLVLQVPSVSSRHFRISRDPDGYLLEDLNSTNGTFVNGERVGPGGARIRPGDTIHLGSYLLSADEILVRLDPLAPPPVELRGPSMVLGRAPDCDRVIDLPMVSSRHARVYREGERILIEDLHSSNGTFVDGRRIEVPTVLVPGNIVGLGSHLVTLAPGSWSPTDPRSAAAPTEAPSSPEWEMVPSALGPAPAYLSTAESTSGLASPSVRRRLLPGLLALSPAVLIPLLGIVVRSGFFGADTPAASLFWLGVAAIWFGMCSAVAFGLFKQGPDGSPRGLSPVRDLPILAGLCATLCLLAWIIVLAAGGLRAPVVPMLGLLFLASAVGVALGGLVVLAAPTSRAIMATLTAIVLVLWLLGGHWRPLHELPAPAGAAASFVPSRWVFEGLLLLASDVRDADPRAVGDPADVYFPRTERMGPKADALALAAILIGLTAGAITVASSRRG